MDARGGACVEGVEDPAGGMSSPGDPAAAVAFVGGTAGCGDKPFVTTSGVGKPESWPR